MYVKFNPVLKKLVFVCYFMLWHVSALTVGHLQGAQQVQVTYNFKETKDKLLKLTSSLRMENRDGRNMPECIKL
jgi:hypothetical protein